MTWLSPLVAGIAAAVAIPVLLILYFLKLRRRDIEISSTFLWKKAIEDLQANAPFQRLRKNILLLLQLLALGALLFAAGQPTTRSSMLTRGRHVIVIDVSASMNALDGESSLQLRLDKAKKDALSVVDGLKEQQLLSVSPADEAMVITFGIFAEVVQSWTSDKNALRSAINSIQPRETPTRFSHALGLIQAQAPQRTFVDDNTGQVLDRPPGRIGTIHIFSDGRIVDAADTIFGPEDDVRYYPVGSAEATNIGVVAVRADREFSDPTKLVVYAGVQSTDVGKRTVDVELRIDGEPPIVMVSEVEIPGSIRDDPANPNSALKPGRAGVEFKLNRPEEGIARVIVRPSSAENTSNMKPDMLGVDNEAWVVIPRSSELTVALVTNDGFGIAELLEVLPLARVDVMTPSEFESALRAGRDRVYDAVVLDEWLPPKPANSDDCLPPGRYLVFGQPPPAPQGLEDRGIIPDTRAAMIDWDHTHPALASVDLDKLIILEPRDVVLGEQNAARVLATSTVGPAIVEITGTECRAICVTYGVMGSTWTLEPSWVVFVGSALNALGRSNDVVAGRDIKPGQTFTDRLPQGASSIQVRTPDNQTETLTQAPDGSVAFGPVRKAGVHTVTWEGAGADDDAKIGGRFVRTFASNLSDPVESDISVITEPEFATAKIETAESSSADRSGPRHLWPWLVGLAVVIVMFEWWVYNRKVYL